VVGEAAREAGGGGVPDDVGQRLLGDAVGRHLDGRRQDREGDRGSEHDRDPGILVPAGPLAQGRDQPQVVEHRRPQRVDEPADVDHRRPDVAVQLVEQGIGRRGVGGHELAGGVQGQRLAGQLRAQPIVQVAPEPAPLLLPGANEALPRPPQVGAEADGVHRYPRLARQVVEQPPIRLAERLTR